MESSKIERYGYAKASSTHERGIDFLLSLVLLTLAVPIFLVIAIIMKFIDRGPVFYKQSRLGYQKKMFVIYKFRTLIPDAEKIIGAEVLDRKHNVVTPFGRFLRNTRLDELPQLLNILRGEMTFIGPRPQRPEIYERFGKHIRDYDKRFSVKPGLIGFPQLFLPHSAPKNIQSRIDNLYLKIRQNYFWEMSLVFFTIFNVFKKFIILSINHLTNNFIKVKLLKRYPEKRALVRKKTAVNTLLCFLEDEKDENQGWKCAEITFFDINEEAFLLKTPKKINMGTHFLCKVVVNFKVYGKFKKKTIICKCSYCRERKEEDGYAYVVFYEPASPLNYYKAHQYLLRKSMAYG